MESKNMTLSPQKWAVRVFAIILIMFPLLMLPEFVSHIKAHFTGAIEGSMITGQWHIVIINIVLFTSFLIPLTYRKKVSWKEWGLVSAFFISLFIEMYGLPLTVMFASRIFHAPPEAAVDTALSVELLGAVFAFTVPMIYGSVLMIAGTIIVVVGWVTLYRRIDREGLVTTGIYSISRHPQYLGFIMVIYGWVVGWTTPLTVVFGSILMIVYVRTCMKEEREMGGDHDYGSYRKRTPFLI
ncbi:MAG: DUF1295 domain-containing protein [Candidatus Thermoplasmatota archaeon]|nr:DUF1295 domain-containing protein [Candidatus Thermoplasmatota archaeon]